MIVTLENNQEKVSIPEALEADLTKAMNVVAELEALSPQTEVDITLVDDAAIHELNRTYRGIDRPTDVLPLPLTKGKRNRKWTMTRLNIYWVMSSFPLRQQSAKVRNTVTDSNGR